MKITLEIETKKAHLLGFALQREMKRKYAEQCLMARNGYGKEFWAQEIDALADLYIQFRDQY